MSATELLNVPPRNYSQTPSPNNLKRVGFYESQKSLSPNHSINVPMMNHGYRGGKKIRAMSQSQFVINPVSSRVYNEEIGEVNEQLPTDFGYDDTENNIESPQLKKIKSSQLDKLTSLDGEEFNAYAGLIGRKK